MSRAGRRERVRAAITGIGCRLPGGIAGPRALWAALLGQREMVGPLSPQRWARMTADLHPDQRPEDPWPAGELEELDAFDADYFRIGRSEAEEMDPQQRILLEVVMEALQDAGVAPSSLAGGRTGVYVGAAAIDQMARAFAPGRWASMYSAGGAAMSILANRVSYTLNLRGPSHTLDSACSSSMVALHQARRDIEDGDVDTAIVGAASVMLAPGLTASFVDGGVLSQRGELRPFDAEGDGYLRGEGVLAVVLTRSDRARERADRVYATVAGSAENSDGRSNGLFAPSRAAQEELLRTAYRKAGLDPAAVDYVEAHGTATVIGDLIEANALSSVLGGGRAGPLLVGSIKSNLGHLEGAAGLAGVAKTALALRHGAIPPTINHDRLRPDIDPARVEVVTRASDWPVRGEYRIAGVNAFGFGGTNAHAILATPHPPRPVPTASAPVRTAPALIPISAHSASALRATAAAWADDVAVADLTAVASTATHRRDHGTHRAAVATDEPSGAATAMRALARGHADPRLRGPRSAPRRPPRVVFVFPGHGAQWPEMGAQLARREPVFATAVREAGAALAAQGAPPWTPGTPPNGFAETQRATFTMQVGLAALWRCWGIMPAAVTGHSLGEAAAAHVAGALSLDAAARLVCARSSLLAETADAGGMLATELTPERAADLVGEHSGALAVAAHNGPRATIISGGNEALAALRARLESDGVWVAPVRDGVPAHGPLLDPVLPRLRTALRGLTPTSTDTTIVSTFTGAAADGRDLDAHYWAHQLRGTVRFAPALEVLAGHPSVFVEISPRGVLGHALAEVVAEWGGGVAAAPRPDRDTRPDEHRDLLAQAGEVYTLGPVPTGAVASGLAPAELSPAAWDHHDAQPAAADDLATALDAAGTPDERRRVIAAELTAIVAEVLRCGTREIDPERHFTDLGLSSIALMELRNRTRGLRPGMRPLAAADVLTHPTISTLSAVVEQRIP